jgi:fatty acid desaturase
MSIKGSMEFRVQAHKKLSSEVLQSLSMLSPFKATLSLIKNLATIAIFIVAALAWPHPILIAVAIFGIAIGQHGLAVLFHESAHYRMYKTRWFNDLIGHLCGLSLGASLLSYRNLHSIHHNHLYEPIDPDLALIAGYPRGRAYLLKKLLKDLFGLTVIKNYKYLIAGQSSSSNRPDRADRAVDVSPSKRGIILNQSLIILFQFCSLIFFLIMGCLKAYLLLWVLPLVTVLQVFLRLRAVCEHGAVPDTAVVTRAARTTLAPFWIRLILFPHQVNYHIEHHLYPSVPHYNLAQCHQKLMALGLLDGAEVVSTFSQTLRKIFASPTVK